MVPWKDFHCVLVTNIPAPYRLPVYARVSDRLFVIFCSAIEGNRSWQISDIEVGHCVLSGGAREARDGFNYRYSNWDVWRRLSERKPSVVVTTGFNPTHLYAFLWSKIHHVPHVCMTDGTVKSESGLSAVHRFVRRVVFAGSRAFIAASRGGTDLYRQYGVPEEGIFQSCLCANVDAFESYAENRDRPFDVMFAGQFHERKLPFLFVDVCAELKRRRGRVRVQLIGDGPLRGEVLKRLEELGIDYVYPGFVQQEDLPLIYSRARIMLFTTRLDPWGVVANEALAAGTPVITTEAAGVAGELVVDGETGFVVGTDVGEWAERCCRLLDDADLWERFSLAGRRLSGKYNYDSAAEGITSACEYALRVRGR